MGAVGEDDSTPCTSGGSCHDGQPRRVMQLEGELGFGVGWGGGGDAGEGGRGGEVRVCGQHRGGKGWLMIHDPGRMWGL